MGVPAYSDADFLAGFQSLLPTGPVWPRDVDSVQAQTLAPLVKGYTRNAASAAGLLADAIPVAPVMLLTEWESTLGLPDPCAGPAPSLQVRQQQVAARFVAAGGQTVAYLEKIAAALGYTITVTQFLPFTVGMTVGQPILGTAWAYAAQINAPTYSVTYFEVGRNAAGDPLASWGNTILQCEIARVAPAHITLLWNYA